VADSNYHILKIGVYRKEICNRLVILMNTLKMHMTSLFDDYDILVTPVSSTPVFRS